MLPLRTRQLKVMAACTCVFGLSPSCAKVTCKLTSKKTHKNPTHILFKFPFCCWDELLQQMQLRKEFTTPDHGPLLRASQDRIQAASHPNFTFKKREYSYSFLLACSQLISPLFA